MKQLFVKIYAVSGNSYLFIGHYKKFCYEIVVVIDEAGLSGFSTPLNISL
jgi:hypothetical protein